jgi:hypothetical protein
MRVCGQSMSQMTLFLTHDAVAVGTSEVVFFVRPSSAVVSINLFQTVRSIVAPFAGAN